MTIKIFLDLLITSFFISLKNLYSLAGGYSKEVTPDPIPNSVVKLFCVDGTACRLWESRSPPAFFLSGFYPEVTTMASIFSPVSYETGLFFVSRRNDTG